MGWVIIAVLLIFLLSCWFWITPKFQLKEKGVFGLPARFLWFCTDLCHSAIEWLRKFNGNLRDVHDLPKGRYVVITEEHKEIRQKWQVYDHRAIVLGREKNWEVVSLRPLPKTFSIDTNGEIRAISV